MLQTYGYAGDCPGCDAKRAGLSVSKPHSTSCRKRVEEEIVKDPRGQEARERADERWKQWEAREAAKKTKEEEIAAPKTTSKQGEEKSEEKEEDLPKAETLDERHSGQAAEVPVPDDDHGGVDMPIPEETYEPGQAASSTATRSGAVRGNVQGGGGQHADTEERSESKAEATRAREKRKENMKDSREIRRRCQVQSEKRNRTESEIETEKRRRLRHEDELKRARELEEEQPQEENKKPRSDDF